MMHPLLVQFEDGVLVSQGRVVAVSLDATPTGADATSTRELASSTIIEVESGEITYEDGLVEPCQPGCYAITSHGLFRQIDGPAQ